jgi:uncharacterized protein
MFTKFASLITLTIFSVFAFAAEPVPTEVVVPELNKQAVFQTKETITPDEQQKIINALEALEAKTKVAMTVLVVDSVAPFAIEEYGIKVAEKWKIGKSKEDNGLIFIIATQDRKARLEVGYGMEGQITDAVSSQLLKDYANPEFKNKNWFGGIMQVIGRVDNIASGKPIDAPLNADIVNASPAVSKSKNTELSGEAAAVAALFKFFGTNIGKAILIGLVIGGIASFFKHMVGVAPASGIGAVISGIVSFMLVDGYFYVAVISGGIFGLIGIMWIFDVLQAMASSSGGGSGGSGGSRSRGYSGGGGKFGGGGSSSSW